MKKILTISLLMALCSVSFASQLFPANLKARFFPQNWTSANSKDVISIKYGMTVGNGSSYYNVQIYVDQPGYAGTVGITVKNCGGPDATNVVYPGSSIICTLSVSNPVITFSSTSINLSASGSYQVE